MIQIDGEEGGGQMLRTSMSLAVLTQQPVEVINVRGDRDNPGLRPQHLAGIRILSRMTSGFVSGGYDGSEQVTFQPRGVPFGEHDLQIGTAGSLTLLFDTLLPLAPILEEPFSVTATGGTDVRWSPTMAYFERVKLATLQHFGLDAEVEVHRSGFYPAGDGEASVTVRPSHLEEVELEDRGHRQSVEIVSKASEDLEEQSVAQRQCHGAVEALEGAGIEVSTQESSYVDTTSTGTSILVFGRYDHGIAGFDNLGERGKPAEEVGAEAAEEFIAFDDGVGSVDSYLGDQLMLPLAIAGGSMEVPRLTNHMRTNAGVINEFGGDIQLIERDEGALITAGGSLLS